MKKINTVLFAIAVMMVLACGFLILQYQKSYATVERIGEFTVDTQTISQNTGVISTKNELRYDIEAVDYLNSAISEQINPPKVVLSDMEAVLENSNRINVLAMGVEDYLSDVILIFSLDLDTSDIDVITVPRDSYYQYRNHNAPWEKKINAVYSFREDGRVPGMIYAVEDLVGMPIDYYIKISKSGVSNVVDALGGYNVYIPYDMDYDDPYDTPPLSVHLKQGQQHLNGEETVGYLRFRKSNDGTIMEGDIDRVKKYNDFFESMLNQSLSYRLPSVIDVVFSQIKTDIPMSKALTLATEYASISSENLNFYTLPGEPGYENGASYYFTDEQDIYDMVMTIYTHQPYKTIESVVKIEDDEVVPESDDESTE